MSTSDFPSSTAHPSPDTPPDDAVYARLARDFITVIRAADEAARRVQAGAEAEAAAALASAREDARRIIAEALDEANQIVSQARRETQAAGPSSQPAGGQLPRAEAQPWDDAREERVRSIWGDEALAPLGPPRNPPPPRQVGSSVSPPAAHDVRSTNGQVAGGGVPIAPLPPAPPLEGNARAGGASEQGADEPPQMDLWGDASPRA